MRNLVYLSYSAAPHQIKLCNAMQKYYRTEFWFYSRLGNRAEFWKYPLGKNCKVIKKFHLKLKEKHLTFQHINWLREFDPDIIMLGGFSIPSNYVAYLWGKLNNKKVIVFTERSRNRDGNLRKRGVYWRILKLLYRNVDQVMVSDKDIIPQFKNEYNFGSKVVASRYASDIDNYMNHSFREPKSEIAIMFPNRLTDIYNPLEAIEIFKEVKEKHKEASFTMNALGELRGSCEKLISEYGLEDSVVFLDNIKNWEELHKEYEKCDIMILPAKFSNGNFTIIEAMASGMGIIISNNVLGVGKLIENNFNGFNIPLERQKFIDSIEAFQNHAQLFKKFGMINKDKVKDLGSEGTAKLYYSLIEKLFI